MGGADASANSLPVGRIRASVQYFDVVSVIYYGGLLKIYCHHCTITIRGHHLHELDNLLAERKVASLLERHQNVLAGDAGSPYIEEIRIGPPNPEVLTRNPV